MHDSLGDRMKQQYENRSKTFLPRRSYTILRLDGKAFHTYTKGLDRPYDADLMAAMWDTTIYLCENIQGCVLGYTQSDEISLLLTDFATITTDAWYDGNVQKMVSVSASLATGIFNATRPGNIATFDSRAFSIPDPVEVANYFIWRQKDCMRNSIQSLAQANFSHKELEGLNNDECQEKLFQERGINWSEQPEPFKNGMMVARARTYERAAIKNSLDGDSAWGPMPAPIFTQSDCLYNMIPVMDNLKFTTVTLEH